MLAGGSRVAFARPFCRNPIAPGRVIDGQCKQSTWPMFSMNYRDIIGCNRVHSDREQCISLSPQPRLSH